MFFDNALADVETDANPRFGASSAVTVHAVGNRFNPNIQGTDAEGKLSVDGPGAKLEYKVVAGKNFMSSDSNAATLRLAENPP